MDSKRMTRSQGTAEFPEGSSAINRTRASKNSASGDSTTPKPSKPSFTIIDRQISRSRTALVEKSPTTISVRHSGSAPGTILQMEKESRNRQQGDSNQQPAHSKGNLQKFGETSGSRESQRALSMEPIQTMENTSNRILEGDELQAEECSQTEGTVEFRIKQIPQWAEKTKKGLPEGNREKTMEKEHEEERWVRELSEHHGRTGISEKITEQSQSIATENLDLRNYIYNSLKTHGEELVRVMHNYFQNIEILTRTNEDNKNFIVSKIENDKKELSQNMSRDSEYVQTTISKEIVEQKELIIINTNEQKEFKNLFKLCLEDINKLMIVNKESITSEKRNAEKLE